MKNLFKHKQTESETTENQTELKSIVLLMPPNYDMCLSSEKLFGDRYLYYHLT